MDRYTHFGLRTDADEQIRRAFRDGFKRAGLTHGQLLEAMEWYRDHGQRLGADPTKLSESFHDFATSKGWPTEHLVAATSVYDVIAERGPAAVLAPTSAEEDTATIARANELLKTDPNAYWADVALQEAMVEALERQEAAPAAEPSVDPYAIERRIAERDVDKFARMMREEPGKYWSSPDLQRQHHDAIEASIQEAPAIPPPAPVPAAVPAMQPAPLVPSPPIAPPEPVKP